MKKRYFNYEITDDGKVFSIPRKVRGRANSLRILKEKRKKLTPDSNGYLRVMLHCNGKIYCYLVHRLVAKLYIPNPLNKPFINHINGIKNDNRVENLEWCTPQENLIHARKTGLLKNYGEINSFSKLKTLQVLEIRRKHQSGMKQKDIGKLFSVGQDQISRIVNRHCWKHI